MLHKKIPKFNPLIRKKKRQKQHNTDTNFPTFYKLPLLPAKYILR